MKYNPNNKACAEVIEKSKRDIEAVNAYCDGLKGTIVTIKFLCSGQAGPYQDSAWEALIFVFSPNVLTTGAPLPRRIAYADAAVLAQIFVRKWEAKATGWGPRLEFLRPMTDPCLLEHQIAIPGRSCCWHVRITQPYSD